MSGDEKSKWPFGERTERDNPIVDDGKGEVNPFLMNSQPELPPAQQVPAVQPAAPHTAQQPPSAQQPPQSAQQPPQFAQQPPQFAQQPPQFAQQPPQFASQPPPFVQQPFAQQPPPFASHPPAFQQQPLPPQTPLPSQPYPAPPPGFPPNREPTSSTSSISYTLDVLMSALHAPNRRRRRFLIAGAVLVLAIGITLVVVVGSSRVGDTIEDDTPDGPRGEMGDPTWVAMETVQVELRTSPPGAHVAVNGWVQPGTTPATFTVLAKRPNTLSFFQENSVPTTQRVEADSDLTAGLDFQLTPRAPDAKTTWVKVVTSSPDDASAELVFDGEPVGSLPFIVEKVTLGDYHHLQVTKEDKAPYVQIFRLEAEQSQLEIPKLNEGTYLDRSTELNVTLRPHYAKLVLNGEPTGPGRAVYDKGQLIDVRVELVENSPFVYTIDTTPAGYYALEPSLKLAEVGGANVRFRMAHGRNIEPCLARQARGSFCWKTNREYREIAAGTWKLTVYEYTDAGRMPLQGTADLTFEAETEVTVTINLDGPNFALEEKAQPWNRAEPSKVDDEEE